MDSCIKMKLIKLTLLLLLSGYLSSQCFSSDIHILSRRSNIVLNDKILIGNNNTKLFAYALSICAINKTKLSEDLLQSLLNDDRITVDIKFAILEHIITTKMYHESLLCNFVNVLSKGNKHLKCMEAINTSLNCDDSTKLESIIVNAKEYDPVEEHLAYTYAIKYSVYTEKIASSVLMKYLSSNDAEKDDLYYSYINKYKSKLNISDVICEYEKILSLDEIEDASVLHINKFIKLCNETSLIGKFETKCERLRILLNASVNTCTNPNVDVNNIVDIIKDSSICTKYRILLISNLNKLNINISSITKALEQTSSNDIFIDVRIACVHKMVEFDVARTIIIGAIKNIINEYDIDTMRLLCLSKVALKYGCIDLDPSILKKISLDKNEVFFFRKEATILLYSYYPIDKSTSIDFLEALKLDSAMHFDLINTYLTLISKNKETKAEALKIYIHSRIYPSLENVQFVKPISDFRLYADKYFDYYRESFQDVVDEHVRFLSKYSMTYEFPILRSMYILQKNMYKDDCIVRSAYDMVFNEKVSDYSKSYILDYLITINDPLFNVKINSYLVKCNTASVYTESCRDMVISLCKNNISYSDSYSTIVNILGNEKSDFNLKCACVIYILKDIVVNNGQPNE